MKKIYKSGEEKNPRNKNTAKQIHQRAEDLAQEINIPFYESLQNFLNNSDQTITHLIQEYSLKFPISQHDPLIREFANLKYQHEFLTQYCEHLDKELQLRRAAAHFTQINAKKSGENRTKPSDRNETFQSRLDYLKNVIVEWEKKNNKKMTYSDFKELEKELCKKLGVSSSTLKIDWYYKKIR